MTLYETEIANSKKYDIETNNGQDKCIALLTSENVAKIESILNLDSNYKNTFNPDKKPTFKKNSQELGYIGSTSYWVKELQFLSQNINVSKTLDNHDYEEVIEYLIRAIDKENSTHLNSDNLGWNVVKKRIITEYSTPTQLIEALKNKDNEYKLLNLIYKSQELGEKNHFSFATKFCHYCSLVLFNGTDEEDMYSIYDEVLKKALPLYIEYYLNMTVKKSEYENDYVKYMEYIDKVRGAAKVVHGTEISRTGFDHLIWYFHKGK